MEPEKTIMDDKPNSAALALLNEARALINEESEDGDYIEEQISYEKYILENFNALVIKKMRRLSYLISKVGLELKEACYHISYTPAQINELFKKHPVLLEFVHAKELEYKKDLLAVLSERGRKDDKIAMWLLEKRFPDEFNRKKGGTGDGDDSTSSGSFKGILDMIQSESDSNPLATRQEIAADGAEPTARDIQQQISSFLT